MSLDVRYEVISVTENAGFAGTPTRAARSRGTDVKTFAHRRTSQPWLARPSNERLARCAFAVVVLAASSAWLSGCAGAVIAAQAFPVAVGGVAMAGAEDRDPFRTKVPFADSADAPAPASPSVQTHLARARCGDPVAQYETGRALLDADDDAATQVEAYTWFRLAATGGVEEAEARLVALRRTMLYSQVRAARERAKKFAPANDCAAIG